MSNWQIIFGALWLGLWSSAVASAEENPADADSSLSERAFADIGLVPSSSKILPDPVKLFGLASFLNSRSYRHWEHDRLLRNDTRRISGPFVRGQSYTTHSRVQNYYSEGMMRWMRERESNPEAVLPDGAVIVKEMHPSNVGEFATERGQSAKTIAGWAVMVRDKEASADGWLWFLHFKACTPANPVPLPFTFSQYGATFCLSCHVSADNEELTFATLENIEAEPRSYTYLPTERFHPDAKVTIQPGVHDNMLTSRPGARTQGACLPVPVADTPEDFQAQTIKDLYALALQPVYLPRPEYDVNPVIQALAPDRTVKSKASLQLMPDLIVDHLVANAGPEPGWVTSSACMGCHDDIQLMSDLPNMVVPDVDQPPGKKQNINISPFGEWKGSLMGMAGRDPVFYAQLSAEIVARPDRADEISNLCFGCHGALAVHKLNEESNGTAKLSLSATSGNPLTDPHNAEIGALARDGVSCTVCHRMTQPADEFEGSGKFELGPTDTVYGPYQDDDITVYPMEQGMTVTPKHGELITDSKLCGSCHNLQVPQLPTTASQGPMADFPHIYEQTTYLEWLNSKYARAGTGSDNDESCIGCHMPRTYPSGEKIGPIVIANVEDETFPDLPYRADDPLITPTPKSSYRRHTLTGINLPVMNMFKQFPDLLGVTTWMPGTMFAQRAMSPDPEEYVLSYQTFAARNAFEYAQTATASTEVASIHWRGDQLSVKVRVTSKVGHKFPSGVGMRRAFLQTTLYDQNGDPIWASGRLSPAGVLVDENGAPLASEFTADPTQLQPDHRRISREDQVQIYEIRAVDDRGHVTGSFLSVAEHVKDNRILPAGWRRLGPGAKFTKPIGIEGQVRGGRDDVEYVVSGDVAQRASCVKVQLYYQSIPPYFLKELFKHDTQEVDRLFYLATHLSEDRTTPTPNWSVAIGAPVESSIDNGVCSPF